MAKRETRSNGVSQLERYRYGKLISSSARDEKIQWNGTRKKGEGGGGEVARNDYRAVFQYRGGERWIDN